MRELRPVETAFIDHEGREAMRKAINDGRAYAARGRYAAEDQGVDMLLHEVGGQRRLKEVDRR